MATKTDEKKTDEKLPDDVWMIRSCEVYIDEFSACTSRRGRFHQKYTTGETQECGRWKEDFENCIQYRRSNDPVTAERVIASERERRTQRIASVRDNDVWEYRSAPPPDWNKPLPENLEKKRLPRITNPSGQSCSIS